MTNKQCQTSIQIAYIHTRIYKPATTTILQSESKQLPRCLRRFFLKLNIEGEFFRTLRSLFQSKESFTI